MAVCYKFGESELDDGSVVRRPRISVMLKNGNRSLPFKVNSLLDSGADYTVIPYKFAVILGLSLSKKQFPVYGFREQSSVHLSNVSMNFADRNTGEEITLERVPVLVLSETDSKEMGNEIVIGVQGVFEHMSINFNLPENKIELKA